MNRRMKRATYRSKVVFRLRDFQERGERDGENQTMQTDRQTEARRLTLSCLGNCCLVSVCCFCLSRGGTVQANLYEDSSLKGLVPVDEIPLCNCRPEDGCDASCIK